MNLVKLLSFPNRNCRMAFQKVVLFHNGKSCECYYCTNLITLGEHSFDHIRPKSKIKKGKAILANLVPCCKNCNTLKGASETIEQFYKKVKRKYRNQPKYLQERFGDKIFDWRDYVGIGKIEATLN